MKTYTHTHTHTHLQRNIHSRKRTHTHTHTTRRIASGAKRVTTRLIKSAAGATVGQVLPKADDHRRHSNSSTVCVNSKNWVSLEKVEKKTTQRVYISSLSPRRPRPGRRFDCGRRCRCRRRCPLLPCSHSNCVLSTLTHRHTDTCRLTHTHGNCVYCRVAAAAGAPARPASFKIHICIQYSPVRVSVCE